ncbi:MAG: HAD family phosphatase [bacterium]|nr:HAD family phosphatase [bacterium]
MHQAVIFDVDGVLVDSYEAHFQSWKIVAAESALALGAAQFAETFGRTSRDIIRLLWPGGRELDEGTVRALDERKEAIYREIIAEDFPVMDGARELVEALGAAGMRLAVGSSGPPENVELVLDQLGGRALFAAVVTGRDVRRGKPDPQVFLIAARRLNVPAAECVVVEDAPAGIQAAKAAGMAGVALVSTGRRAEEFDGVQPDLVVRSLRELSAERLRGLEGSQKGPPSTRIAGHS